MPISNVLIVEDDRIVAEDLSGCLKKLGFGVAGIVDNGPAAITLVYENRPDLVLMDIVLKGAMNGTAAAELIKTRFNVPVIYLTAFSDEGIFERAKTTDPFGYLLKPFNEQELRIAIHLALYKHDTEKRLQESKDSFHNIVAKTTDGIIVLDKAKHAVRFLNPAAQKLLGRSNDEIIGRTFDYPFVPEGVCDVAISQQGKNAAFVEINTTRTQWEGEDAFLLSLRDITKRRQTEAALLKSERCFRELVENALVCILIICDDVVVYQNPQQKMLFGSPPTPFRFEDFLEHVNPYYLKEAKKCYQDMVSKKKATMNIVIRLYPMGKKGVEQEAKWMQCIATLIEYGENESILLSMADITQTKQLEHILRIREKMSTLGQVAAGIAHEIRNPLAGIIILLDAIKEALQRTNEGEEVAELIVEAKNAADKIEAVIRRVNDFVHTGSLHLVRMDINHAVEATFRLSRANLKKAGVTLEKQLAENLPPIYIDCNLVEQVLLNLVVNAVESMDDTTGPKRIRIVTGSDSRHVLVKVLDTGPGIREEMKLRIFDPFYSTKTHGTGIGLSICQQIVTNHGGRIEATGGPNRGAEFTIWFPKKQPTPANVDRSAL